MTTVHVLATFAFGGWDVTLVVVAPEPDGAVTRGLIFHIPSQLQIDPGDLWAAIVAKAGRTDIALPVPPAAPPTSPSPGVHAWRWGPTA